MLEFHDFSVTLRGKEIVHKLDAEFPMGVHGLLGPNGAGKTTFMRGMLGLYHGRADRIMLDGEKLDASKVGYLPQKFNMFPNMTVTEALQYFGSMKKLPTAYLKEEIPKCIEAVNLGEKAKERVSRLSGGMVRRMGIAQAILGNPRLIVLDEPTAGLDPEERLRMKNLIHSMRQERIVIISTHIVDDVEYLCDYLDIMNEGSILFQDTCEAVRKKAEGKVYEIPAGQMQSVSDGYLVKEHEINGVKCMRYLMPQGDSAYLAEPGIEDGYLCILKNI